ncbi:FAD binding domain-containing protein [uncultured Cetobacterium sp.]|uniref:FAD binding domain-containing protein n=1 Tax=uncultured Cetobacterium sp. TaxID=527638 RepID=UPI00260CF012|nr:FAD binding domain-containing protein [uncultured Cetobacterium sp.]
MFSFSKYFLAQSLDEAYVELIKNKKNIILGGTSYLRMGNTNWNTAIDISNLNLRYISENDSYISLGAMTTFRDLEINPLLKTYFGEIFNTALKDVIGVQFRSNVTVGATVFSKYGFSDLIPALLALNAKVKLFNFGEISLENFLEEQNIRKDILVEILIPKVKLQTSFKCVRKSKTDYSILNMAVSYSKEKGITIAVGSRPTKALLAKNTMSLINSFSNLENSLTDAMKTISNEIIVDSNMRGSKSYRELLLAALLRKTIQEVLQ